MVSVFSNVCKRSTVKEYRSVSFVFVVIKKFFKNF